MVEVAAIDTQLFLFIQQFTGNKIIDFFFLAAAETLVLLVPAVLIYLWFESPESRNNSVFTFAATISGIAFSYILGLLYFHHQPFYLYNTVIAGGDLENAFASQHTAAMFSVFWSFVYLKRRRLMELFGIAGALTGLGRIFVGLHYPLDVLGGIFSGLIGVFIAVMIFRFAETEIEKMVEVSYQLEDRLRSTVNQNI